MEEIKLSRIELVETDSQENGDALQYFCIAWPTFYVILQQLTEKIKAPWWRWAAQLGISIINQIHGSVCAVK